MDTLELVYFDDGRLRRMEEIDVSKSDMKKLRIKDLHKNVCKRPYERITCVSQTSISATEPSPPHGDTPMKSQRSGESSETEYETCEDDDFAAVDDIAAVNPRLLPPTRVHFWRPPALVCGQKQTSKRSVQTKPCLPDESQRDTKSDRDVHKKLRSRKRDRAKPKVKHSGSHVESLDIVSRRSRRQLCEVPTETYLVAAPVLQREDDATSGDRIALDCSKYKDLSTRTSSKRGKLTKQSNIPPCSGQQRAMPRSSGVGFDYYECLEFSTDTKPRDGRDKIPESKIKLGSKSPHEIMKEMLPLKWRYSCTDASKEEIVPTLKIGETLDTKLKETRGRTIESKLKQNKGKTIGNCKTKSKRSYNPPDTREGKSVQASKSRTASRKLKCEYTSVDASNEVKLDIDNRCKHFPTFAVEMKHSNVIAGFSLSIPVEFTCKHMPNENESVVLQDSQGLKWDTSYLAHKRSLSAGWRRFAQDHGLELGHVVVFELIKPLNFLVHMIGASAGGGPVVTAAKKVPMA